MSEYLVALKRGVHGKERPNWQAELAGIPGLTVKNPGAHRLRVEATSEAISEARTRLSDICHIEPVTRHRPS